MTSGSVDDALGSATISRAFILFFCSFNSNSILKNPAQYNTIDITEIMVAKEGELCFWAVMLVNSPPHCTMQCLSNSVSARYVILTSRAWTMWQSISYLYSFSCYATQSLNPSRQVFLIDIKTHEKVPEFMEDVLTELGIRQLSFRTREIRALCGLSCTLL